MRKPQKYGLGVGLLPTTVGPITHAGVHLAEEERPTHKSAFKRLFLPLRRVVSPLRKVFLPLTRVQQLRVQVGDEEYTEARE